MAAAGRARLAALDVGAITAFMAQLLGQLRTNAQLMAHFERAILVIEQEQTLRSRRNLEHQRKQRQRERKRFAKKR